MVAYTPGMQQAWGLSWLAGTVSHCHSGAKRGPPEGSNVCTCVELWSGMRMDSWLPKGKVEETVQVLTVWTLNVVLYSNCLVVRTLTVLTVAGIWGQMLTWHGRMWQSHIEKAAPFWAPSATVADCASRQTEPLYISLARRVCYHFAEEVTLLARPVHAHCLPNITLLH